MSEDDALDRMTDLCSEAYRLAKDLDSERLLQDLRGALIEIARMTVERAGLDGAQIPTQHGSH